MVRRLLYVLAGAVVACQVVAGIDRVEKVVPVADDDAAVADPCPHVTAPGMPATDDDPAGTVPPFWLAVREVSLTPQRGDGTYDGLDLDGVCTCDRRPGSVNGGRASCISKADACDFDGGADNRGATLFQQFTATGTDINKGIVDDIAEGNSGLLVWIAGWNGKANDRDVRVGLVVSTGVRASGCGTALGLDGEHYPPGWCGQDPWDYEPGSVIPINGVVQAAGNGPAYVADGTLVYRSPDAARLSIGGATVAFNTPVSFGKLEANEGGGYKLAGFLGGRIAVGELLGTVGQLKFGGTNACETKEFEVVRGLLCDAVDITRTSASDFQDARCDAVSSAMRFAAFPAQLGNAVPRPTSDNPCAPGLHTTDGKYDCP